MLEFTKKSNSAALAFMAGAAFWFLIATVYGLFSAVHLMAPEFFNNIGFLVFGRTRPIHVNTMVFGFVAPMLIGAALYYVPALLRTRLWSQRVGWAAWLLWQITVFSGLHSFSQGQSQGREYAEYLWIFDVCLVGAFLLLIFNFVMTVASRQENTLYVSAWYVLGALFWTAGVYPIGNVMWRPDAGAVPGLLDSVFLWFYGHNLVGLLLTPLAVGAAYYVIPRVTRRPLYSHTLSLIGFWTLIAIYSHIGGHHILQSPIPNWLKTISVVDSMMMFVPVMTVLVNLWLTPAGTTGSLWRDTAGRFIFVGSIWYFITCVQGPLQSLPAVQKITHFSNWTIGHAHIAVLGFAGFIALGTMWHVLPLATGRVVHSRRLVSVQFGLLMLGLLGFFAVLTVAGLVQGAGWNNGETVYRVLPEISIYMILRALFGVLIFTAAAIGLYNVMMTIWRSRAVEQEELLQ
jgi:cytochrome c oxidase cbb3-type subunit I